MHTVQSDTKMSKKLLIIIAFLTGITRGSYHEEQEVQEIIGLIQDWTREIGDELKKLSHRMTRKDKAVESFLPLKDKIKYKDGKVLVEDIARDLRSTMDSKTRAVKNIAEYAEFLAYHRPTDNITTNESEPGAFRFYDADLIDTIDSNKEREKELEIEIKYAECHWWCHQKNLQPLKNNLYNQTSIKHLFRLKSKGDGEDNCDCLFLPNRERSVENYFWLPMKKTKKYENRDVNMDLSTVKIATNIYNRDQDVLQGIRWSEALDVVFKENLLLDKTLKYQYFTSPLGYMRHFPGVRWSQEKYDRTYDPRTRSWYTEAMTSPKDIVILLDRSGSMEGQKRKLSAHIVNNILDTLNDNDFINIITFTNSTAPLVPCFEDTLVQANEENLRLLRESLDVYKIEFVADISLGFTKAFDLLKRFRESRTGSNCNQAIMLITEGVDYDYKRYIFNYSNWMLNTPVRIFTYCLHTNEEDARNLEWIACANKGYFVNVSLLAEVREKVLNYMNVMSRPINCDFRNKQEFIWSYLYIDLADRRYSNWLWRKYEGIRQREVFLDHVKREIYRSGKVFTSQNHILLQDTHDYEKYKEQITNDFDYMTTVSLPVYGRRPEDVDLIGVAAVDVPIKLIKSLIPHYILGVNGYAFIVTNNGYVLMHPDHRPEFERIPKPTFNRVDFLEVEILDDKNEPRRFDKSIVELRKKLVNRKKGDVVLNVKYTVDDLKRVVLSKRRYFFTELGPFSLGIALPDKYGLMVLNTSSINSEHNSGLVSTKKWKVHPDWVYCVNSEGNTPEDIVLNCLKNRRGMKPLLSVLIFDAYVTKWFDQRIPNEREFVLSYQVKNVFLSTQSGLTRWRNFVPEQKEDFQNIHTRAIDEDWYRRTVEENFNKDENMFIYSVPFEISGFEEDTLVTVTNTIFVKEEDKKTPVAVVGLQFNHTVLSNLFKNITQRCSTPTSCEYTCNSSRLDCFILDNNAYVIVSDNIEFTGRFIGDIKPDLMYHLVKNGVYKPTRMFDYQAICYKLPPSSDESSAGTNIIITFRHIIENLSAVINWALTTLLFVFNAITYTAAGDTFYKSIKNDTIAFEKLKIDKTYPTPCDQEMWLFTLGDKFNSSVFQSSHGSVSKFTVCELWPYVVEKIPNTNLLFLAANGLCNVDTTNTYDKSPTPQEITYDESLPCYIAIHNNFSRRIYMNCYNECTREDNLNENRFYCGHTWK